jgi:hypothetical protein
MIARNLAGMSASDYSFKTVNWMPVVSFGQALWLGQHSANSERVTAVLRMLAVTPLR